MYFVGCIPIHVVWSKVAAIAYLQSHICNYLGLVGSDLYILYGSTQSSLSLPPSAHDAAACSYIQQVHMIQLLMF